MSGKNSIQVAIKVRPLKEKDQQSSWRVVDNSIQLIDSQTDPYYFDHIFDQDATNQIIFDKMAKQIVHSAIQGFNGTIFAYGQTSSGKTYTMMGDEDNPGVMVLAAKEIFRDIERTQDRQFLLRVGYIEIYNEKIYDLLNKKNQDLKIHETSTGIVSVNCEECIIRSEDDLLNHLNKGSKERKVGETNMNERSSRSHAIFRIIIESRKMDRGEDDAVIQSVINLVDLAGSERADQTGARGTRLKEGGHINKSLLFLSNVIKRLSENEDDKYISYRDSKLTRILQASLGGNALTAIICTIKPNAVEETQSTLSFALRAKTIKNKPQVNEIVTDATMMKRLEREIKILKSRLEEEQRRNESQIKVRQLEQRIKDEDLKIISYNSLHSIRNREKRRRTWCPSSTNLDTSAGNQQPSALPISTLNSHLPSNLPQASRLQAPKTSYYNTPLITLRPTPESQSTVMPSALPKPPDDLAEIDEEFADAELVNFDMLPSMQTPKNQQTFRKCSITPKLAECPRSTLAKVEHDLMELQSFTNLENKTEVQYDPDLALKQQVETLRQRNAVLENERLEYLELKDEFELISNNFIESQRRSDELQIQISKLTNSNKIANEKITKYEAELAALKKTNEKLEMENREAVNLEFEFQRHKNKSKLRETELLEALSEKEKEVSKLEKSLNAITAERIQNSKEELLHKSQSDECQETENGKVCIKCEDLQRLLDENNKITLEFEKLTLEYEKLKLNYTEIERESETNKLKITELQELHEKEKAVSDKLLEDVQKLRDKLQNVQRDYEQLSTENSSKNEECMALSRQVEVAREEMMVLEEKFTKLETSWQEQQQTLCDIETQYASIQIKYEQLQYQYEQLEVTRGQSLTDCQRLERENVELQTEIEDLKRKVQDAQEKLLKSHEMFEVSKKECAMANEERLSETSKIQQDNETLKQQLLDMQTQFDDLQKEYEDLSNQLMDSLQESESLKNENIKVQEKLKEYEMKNEELSTTTDDEINNLRPQLENVFALESKPLLKTPSPCRNSSMRSSGVCVTEEDDEELEQYTEDMFKKFCELSESLTEIELEHTKGNTKVFKSASKNSTPNYKMYLKNIFGVRKSQKEFNMEIENVHLQGSFKHHSFHIVELSGEDKSHEIECDNLDINGCDDVAEYIEKLKQEIVDLRAVHEQECSNNKLMLESTERALAEMREQFQQLSAELLEKSIFVENCACKTYQQQIETLEKEKANITVMCEELQEKVNCTLNGSFSNLMNNTTNGNESKIEDKLKDLENLRFIEQQLEELTQRYGDVENDLQTAREKLERQEKEYEEKSNQMRLENLEKLEISANEYRDNIKKHNKEWEDKKENYELTIQELRQQIEQLKLLEPNNKDLKLDEETQQVNNRGGDLSDDAHEATCNNQNDMTDDLKIIQLEKLELELAKQTLEQQVNCLEEQLKDVQEENHKYIEEMSLLDNKISTLDDQLSIISNEKVSLEIQLEELKEELKCIPQLQKYNQELTDEVDRLNSEHKDLLEKLHKTEVQIEDLCTEDSKREKIIGALESKLTRLEAMEEEKKILENELGLLKETCSQLQETLKSFYEKEQEYETIKKEVTTLKEDCEKLNTSQTELLAKNCALEGKLQEQTTDKAMLETQLKVLNEEKITLLGKCAVLQEAKDALEEQLNCLKGKEEIEGLLEQMMNEKTELSQKIRIITEKMESLEKELAHKDEEFKAEREQMYDIQKNLLITKELFNEKQQQLIETEKEKEKIKQERISINEELEELRQKVLKTNEDNEVQEKEIANLKQQLVTINDKLYSLLGAKCERQLDFGKVKQAQYNLQRDLEALSKTLKEKQQEFKTLEDNYHKAQSENEELQELNAHLTNCNIHNEQQLEEFAKLQQELEVAKDSLASLTDEKQNLQEQLESCKNLKEEKSKLERTLNIIKSAQAGAITKLQLERDQLQKTVKQYEGQQTEFKEKEETLYQKIETLTQQLHELRCKAQTYEKLLTVHEEVETALSKATTENEKLREDVSQLKDLSGEIEKLNFEMDKHLNEKRDLETELSCIKETLQDEKTSLQRELQEMNSCMEELKLKCDTLQNANTQLQNLNQQLEQQTKEISDQLKAFHNLQDDFNRIKSQNTELQYNLKTKIEEAGRCSSALREELKQHKQLVQKQQENMNSYKNEMETKCHSLEQENLKLSSNIATLQNAKQTLEDRLREITVRNFEQDLQRQAIDATANISGDSNKSGSPRGRRSQERLSGGGGFANISIEEKLISAIQHKNSTTTERKNRRLSTHDERRRQSYWGASHDKETMTDPVDNSCNCLELDGKLKECERNLFIKNSQVTALNMQLKNHPLKDENAALMKRLLEEQEKHRNEIKRYKNKLHELTVKADKAVAAAAHATAKSNHAAVTAAAVAEQNSTSIMPVVTTNVEVQTDDEFSLSLHKLQAKYVDLKNICRYRFNLIKELEAKVTQKENTDGNSLSPLEAAEHKLLNNQCESLKRELKTVKDKYENAKKVLHSRREEIQKLRAQLDEAQLEKIQ